MWFTFTACERNAIAETAVDQYLCEHPADYNAWVRSGRDSLRDALCNCFKISCAPASMGLIPWINNQQGATRTEALTKAVAETLKKIIPGLGPAVLANNLAFFERRPDLKFDLWL